MHLYMNIAKFSSAMIRIHTYIYSAKFKVGAENLPWHQYYMHKTILIQIPLNLCKFYC